MTDDVDWDRLRGLVRVAGRAWSSHRLWPDLAQEGLWCAWRNRGCPDAHIIVKARSVILDAARRELSRPGRVRQPELLIIDASPDLFTGAHVDPSDPVLELGLSGRDRTIATGVVAGALYQDIAADIGVSPRRVSQILAEWRTLAA